MADGDLVRQEYMARLRGRGNGGALTRERAAAYLGVSIRQVDCLAHDGAIPKTKIGRTTLFQVKHLDDFLDEQTEMTRADVERSVANL